MVDYVRRYVYKPPSAGYKKLQDADALDLACEALVADGTKPYAYLFTDEDRQAASKRLAPHMEATQARKAASDSRISVRRAGLPSDVAELRALAEADGNAEDAVAINSAILEQAADDVVAMIRLGRAYQTLGLLDEAKQAFQQAVSHDPHNAIAKRRLEEVERRERR